jgi:hypothetical protein
MIWMITDGISAMALILYLELGETAEGGIAV